MQATQAIPRCDSLPCCSVEGCCMVEEGEAAADEADEAAELVRRERGEEVWPVISTHENLITSRWGCDPTFTLFFITRDLKKKTV